MPDTEPTGKYIVVQGIPDVYGDLFKAEERAAELAEEEQCDYTVMAVPEDAITEKSLVYRYMGVACMTLQEARKQDKESELWN